MAVGTVSGVAPDEVWQLVASQAMSGLNTYTFSGLTGYKTYWLVGKNLTSATAEIVAIRPNGDTASGSYANLWSAEGNGTANVFLVGPNATGSRAFSFEISDADKSIPHKVKATTYNGTYQITNDAYVDLTPITSLVVKSYGGSNFSGGTVYLYGIAA